MPEQERPRYILRVRRGPEWTLETEEYDYIVRAIGVVEKYLLRAYTAHTGCTLRLVDRQEAIVLVTVFANPDGDREAACKACGCSGDDPCDPPCAWADEAETLCTACAGEGSAA